MAQWQLAIALRRHADVPLYRQIARAIVDDIRRGRLRPGQSVATSTASPDGA